jgi:hypothetical protein
MFHTILWTKEMAHAIPIQYPEVQASAHLAALAETANHSWGDGIDHCDEHAHH